MITSQIVQLVVVGDLAMDVWRAQERLTEVQAVYHRAIRRYEAKHGQLSRLVSLSAPEHAAVREFTAPQYKAVQQAKRRVYALKVRQASACAKMARMVAERVA